MFIASLIFSIILFFGGMIFLASNWAVAVTVRFLNMNTDVRLPSLIIIVFILGVLASFLIIWKIQRSIKTKRVLKNMRSELSELRGTKKAKPENKTAKAPREEDNS